MFNDNTYTDSRTAFKHVLIPRYAIQAIQQSQNVTKLNIHWLFGEKRPISLFEIEPSKR